MAQKLAIAISGAVSLGSFESGVMYEIIEAIAQHNLHPNTTEDQKIVIDVITGASAGAMTAAIVAQKLLFEADKLREPLHNDIYRAWVEEADIQTLLQFGMEDNPDMAILSSGFVQQVGNKYLLNRYNSNAPTSIAKRHPAVAKSIQLGIALSNLNGFDFKINLTNIQGQLNSDNQQNNAFTYTKHKDCYITQIQSDKDDNYNLWELIKRIAIASGSFPFAFQVQEVDRISSDSAYKGSEFYTEPEPGKEPNKQPFAYTDGGVFENEPLGMAISLAKKLDKSPQDYEKRFFLYVAPGPKSSSINKDFTAAKAFYVNTAFALAGGIFTQSRFQDWIQVSDANESVEKFNNQALFLRDLLKQHPEKYSEFAEVAEKLLNTLYTDIKYREADEKRLKQQFEEEVQQLTSLGENGKAIASSWLKAVQALEKAANLGAKELLTVYAITAKDGELAGEKLSAFGGFFDRKFRDYDYYIGREKAAEFLRNLQKQNSQGGKKTGQIYLLNCNPGQNLQKPAVHLGDVELDNVDRKLRKQVKSLLLERLGRIIDSVEKRPLIAFPLKFFVKKMAEDKLEEILHLKR
ncbi:patatin-like phospholipase family protein [Synechocystis sp. PCC 7509]|uniref:patatin-like phospholipase family protein n=1 Tax=Synechocystis sp. PCC 7509 TaxID=927677 RepID=UPI0002AC02A7|nr:patatin-like phospholipase family protein [Synechocystis sp. PCC 7509]